MPLSGLAVAAAGMKALMYRSEPPIHGALCPVSDTSQVARIAVMERQMEAFFLLSSEVHLVQTAAHAVQ